MNNDVTRRDKRRSFLGAVAVASVVMLIGAPVVQAAVQTVKVKGVVTTKSKGGNVNAKIKDTNGLKIESEVIAPMGLLDAEGSEGAIAVRNFAGGTGFLGTGDCTEAAGTPTDPRPNVVTVDAGKDVIITGVIITGEDANVAVTAPELVPAIGPGAINTFRTTAQNPNLFIGLGTGLTVSPARLVFTCTGSDGGDGSGNFTILGQ